METTLTHSFEFAGISTVPIGFNAAAMINRFGQPVLMLASIGSNKVLQVLLADDDEDDKTLFRDAISDNVKVEFHTVADGEELMDYLHKTKILPDMIFLDLNMPGKNGKKCLEEIRADKRLRSLPVVIYSTSSHKHDIDETYKLGANLYVKKPNSFRELKETANKVIHINWETQQPNSARASFIYKAPRNS